MGNIILIGIIVFLAVMTFVGYQRGLVKTIFSFLSMLIILVVVTVLTPTAQIMLKETMAYSVIRDNVQVYIEENIGKDFGKGSAAGLGASEQKKVIESLPLPQNIKEELIHSNTEEGYQLLEVTNFTDYLVEYVTYMVINAIAFVLLFVVVAIAINVAVYLLDIITKLPVLNFFNRGGGAFIGFAQAMVIVWIACIILTAFGATGWGQNVLAEINNHVVLSLIYNYNLLEIIIRGFF